MITPLLRLVYNFSLTVAGNVTTTGTFAPFRWIRFVNYCNHSQHGNNQSNQDFVCSFHLTCFLVGEEILSLFWVNPRFSLLQFVRTTNTCHHITYLLYLHNLHNAKILLRFSFLQQRFCQFGLVRPQGVGGFQPLVNLGILL